LPSLGYKITDRHLPRRFVTFKKPLTTILCDYLYCDCTNHLDDCSVLACGHDYHSYCLQICQSKCLIYLDYLQVEIKKNVNAIKESMMKKLNESEFIDENNESTVDDDSDNVETATDDVTIMENLLEYAKRSFLEL